MNLSFAVKGRMHTQRLLSIGYTENDQSVAARSEEIAHFHHREQHQQRNTLETDIRIGIKKTTCEPVQYKQTNAGLMTLAMQGKEEEGHGGVRQQNRPNHRAVGGRTVRTKG